MMISEKQLMALPNYSPGLSDGLGGAIAGDVVSGGIDAGTGALAGGIAAGAGALIGGGLSVLGTVLSSKSQEKQVSMQTQAALEAARLNYNISMAQIKKSEQNYQNMMKILPYGVAGILGVALVYIVTRN